MAIKPNSALLVVDMQNDFLPGGALPVPEGDVVISPLNDYIQLFESKGCPIFASRDWHPEETIHFRRKGGNWPAHCVQGTEGAEFAPDLKLPEDVILISKGMDPQTDGYSAFIGEDEQGRPAIESFRERGIEHLYVGGLALDYCVRVSTLDAMENGLGTTVLIDATRAVNEGVHDGEKAVEEVVRAGANIATIEHLRT